MNKKIDPKAFRESMDRCYSGVKGNPFLAGQIIASEKAENGANRTISVRFVSIVAVLVLLAVAAVAAATSMVYTKVWGIGDGEELHDFSEQEIYAQEPESYPGISMSRERVDQLMNDLVYNCPEDEYVVAWIEYSLDGVNTTRTIKTHEKNKIFDSFEDFRQFMMNVEYMTIPSWIPEDLTEHFYAEVHFGLKSEEKGNEQFLWEGMDEKNEKAQLIEEGTKGPVHFRRYHFDEADAIIKGYTLIMESEKLGNLTVNSLLSTYEDMFEIDEDATRRKVEIPGMDNALLVIKPDPEWPHPHDLLMRRFLDGAALFGTEMPVEEILYLGNDGSDPDCMVRMFSGK